MRYSLRHKVPVLVEIKPLHGLMDKTAACQYKGNVSSPRNTGHPDEPAGPKVRHENPKRRATKA